MFWASRTFGNAFLADSEHALITGSSAQAQHLIWYVPPSGKRTETQDLDRRFRGKVDVAVFRSGWGPDDLFVGVKGGYNQVNHGHLDLGNFELDALGERWARDHSLYIGAHQYLVVWCDNQLTQAGVHSNFKLSKSGEYIALVDTDGVTVIDSLSFGAQTTDISWGRQPDGAASWAAMAPTPGAANLLTAVATEPLRPLNFELSAYPNPFNPGATIRYTLPSVADISIKVYDVLGKEVKTLVTGEMTAGTHSFWFDASACGSGVYFCRLTGGNFAKTVKLVVVK